MANVLIERMAKDLGIAAFRGESEAEFARRVSYSAISSWEKTITFDESVGSRVENLTGVSRRHLYERACAVLDMLCAVTSGLEEWYKVGEGEEHPIQLIRTRLLNHGDFLNAGFDTNITLSEFYVEPLTNHVETAYGELLNKGVHYNGIATIRLKDINGASATTENAVDWMTGFITDAWWSSSMADSSQWQYYNPLSKVKNHYLAWQDSVPDTINGIVLARSVINVASYEYYLLKPMEKLVHRLDPFLKERGEHLRIMYALRACCGNPVEARVTRYSDHYVLGLNARLPVQEKTLIESYCWPLKHVTDNLNWIMNEYIWDYLFSIINALGIRLVEETNG